MLKNNIIKKPQSDFSILLKAKQVPKKIPRSENRGDKENRPELGNKSPPDENQMVDMTKKIKKFPHKIHRLQVVSNKKFEEDGAICRIHGVPCYSEDQLGLPAEYQDLIVPQRIDNDMPTDDEQVQSGVNKLFVALKAAVELSAASQ